MKYIVGRKVGMTQIFDEKGKVIPVTIVKTYPCTVVDIRTKEKNGYCALQVGFESVDPKKITKPKRGYFEKKNISPFKFLKEFRVQDVTNYKVGDVIRCDIFKVGEYVDAIGTSKGKGFQGVVRRHGFSGGPASHGSMVYRRPMSIGATDPARVMKGKRMPGHMGMKKVTVQNLRVVKIDKENELVILSGAVPGPQGGIVTIRSAIKKVGTKEKSS